MEIRIQSPIKVVGDNTSLAPDRLAPGEIAIFQNGADLTIYASDGKILASLGNSGNPSVPETPVIRPLTYGKLVSSARLGYFTPGSFYLLTDYECTLKGFVASDEKGDNGFDILGDTPAPFNLLLMAVDKNTLSERCWAVRREGDSYFPAAAKFGEWQLWYCLENDTARFPWADPKGKGLIYRMIDENRLEAPYDFKNVRMKREKFPPGVGGFSPGYYWTFSEKTPDGVVVDASLRDNQQLTNITLRGMASDNGPKEDVSPTNAVILYDFAARGACDHSVIEDSYDLTLGAVRLSEIRHSGHVRAASLFRTNIDRSLNIESGGNLGNMTFSACDGMYLANNKWSGSGRFSDCRNIRGYMNSQTMANCQNITLPAASAYGGGCAWDTCLNVELTKAPYHSIFRNVRNAAGVVTGQMKTVENIAGTSEKKAVLAATGADGTVVTQDSGSAVREFFIGDLTARLDTLASQGTLHDLFVAAGATPNKDGKTWTMNGITDLTTQELINAYQCRPIGGDIAEAYANVSPLKAFRTNFPIPGWYNPVFANADRLCYQNKNIEVLKFGGGEKIEDAFCVFRSMEECFFNAAKLRIIDGVKIVIGGKATNVFYKCLSLEEVRITGMNTAISFSDSPLLSKDSILFLITKAQPAKSITITLHPTAYAMATADAEIQAALQAQPLVSLAEGTPNA